jgi:hypothetical protein
MAGTTKKRGRKLLIASVGVAAVSYVACSSSRVETSGNLVAPPQEDAATDGSSDADGAPEDSGNYMDVVANLIAPPLDASDDGADK